MATTTTTTTNSIEDGIHQQGADVVVGDGPKEVTRRRKNVVTILCILAAVLVVGLAIVLGITITKEEDLEDSTSSSFVATNSDSSGTSDSTYLPHGTGEVGTTEVITDPPTPTPHATLTAKALETMVDKLPAYSRASLQDPASSQNQGLQWLLYHPQLLEMSEKRKLQLFVLATFYYSMQGPNWSHPKPAETWLNYSHHECSWHFEPVECFLRGHCHNITQCNNNNEFIAISLQRLGLRPYGDNVTVPPEIELLPNLSILSLYSSWIHTPLDKFLPSTFYQMTNMLEINLRTNQLSGPIPTRFGEMTNLHSLSMAGNRLNGTLPTQLGLMKGLSEAYLWRNQLTGKIPTQLARLSSKLEDFELVGNALTGTIPTQLALLTNIETLHIQQNAFTGEIPTQFGAMPKLRSLSLRQNDLTGTIPPQLASNILSPNLEVLRLEDNALEGSIPQEFGNDVMVESLVRITMHGNDLTGTVPLNLCALGAYNDFEKKGVSFDCRSTDDEDSDPDTGICGCDGWCPCWVVGQNDNTNVNSNPVVNNNPAANEGTPINTPGQDGGDNNSNNQLTDVLQQQLVLLKDP